MSEEETERPSSSFEYITSLTRAGRDELESRRVELLVHSSDSEEEVDSHPITFHEVMMRPGSVGEAFCNCYKFGRDLECKCGEDDTVAEFEWVWDNNAKSAATVIGPDRRYVKFHPDYSCGTAVARGTQPMKDHQYYWEIKMVTPVYGTDMMVGVGTSQLNLDKYRHNFCSFLGKDADSWGLSYTGLVHHKGEAKKFAGRFTQGSIIGVHLDMWRGTLTFYKNRKLLGTAHHGLNGKALYPMVSSTAARSGMKIIRCRSFRTSLQFQCCQVLRSCIPPNLNVAEAIDMPPGLRGFLFNNLDWLMRPCEAAEAPRSKRSSCRGMKRRWADLSQEDATSSSTEEPGPSSSSFSSSPSPSSSSSKRFKT